MTALLRIAIIGVIMMLTAASAAAQGRGDHDTPATQDPSESGRPQSRVPECRTTAYGWVVCRDRNGNWQRQNYNRRFGGNRWYNYGNDWFGGTSRVLPRDVVIDNLHRWNFDDLRDMKRVGDVYVLKAVDAHGRPVRLTVDVFSGRIISSDPR